MKNRTLRYTIIVIALMMAVYLIAIFAYGGGGEMDGSDVPGRDEVRTGDIIFHMSHSSQSDAIRAATGSRYTHCGIIYVPAQGEPLVLEAIQPVTLTPLEKWIARGHHRHYVVKRLRDADEILTPAALKQMEKIARGFIGKPYDLRFEWSDERIYCSELIWKIFQRGAGVELGELQTLGQMNLSAPAVKEKLKERFGASIPYNETVITPAAIYRSSHLRDVIDR